MPIEIRDPIHVFVRLADSEQAIIDSAPFQRLRDIHQLALTYQVYPGATHRRFEHSLGVMELASRIFDVVVDPAHLEVPAARAVVPEDRDELGYWRRVLRAAALFHDVGHLPFSHAAEDRLLPTSMEDHEDFSRGHILSDAMRAVWMATTPPLRAEDVAGVAIEPREGETLKPWIAILNEIITGRVFGADRIDYLLRDSHHAGVAYGHFDHYRLIDTLRILRPPTQGEVEERKGTGSDAPELGITKGGLQVAESLLLARYSMFTQVYYHRTRRIYDVHLADFLAEWLDGGRFAEDLDKHLAIADDTVMAAIHHAARSTSRAKRRLRELAQRITDRSARFKTLYERSPADVEINADAALIIANAACEQFGEDVIRLDAGGKDSTVETFPVRERDGSIVASTGTSEVLSRVPASRYEYVFVHPAKLNQAKSWLDEHKADLLEQGLSTDADV
jgi:uncharacterized protein